MRRSMAALQSQCTLSSSVGLAKLAPLRRKWRAAAYAPPHCLTNRPPHLLKRQSPNSCGEDVVVTTMANKLSLKEEQLDNLSTNKLLAVLEAAADRAEMHAIIGQQRDGWNHLFVHSINSITLTASVMAGLAGAPGTESALALNLSSAALFASATALMLLVNKIQPSQLAEEQRSAARLFHHLERSIRASLRSGAAVNEDDVEEAMEKVLALQRAYPLPLLPGMLEKFPKTVEPTRWWPKQRPRQRKGVGRNGWSREVEYEMRVVASVLKAKDEQQYLRFGELVLSINKFLALAGPLLSGVAAAGAVASSLGGAGGHASLAAVVGGALAAVVNTVEHGGQVGMVFELLRNCAGFYRGLEEEIEFTLGAPEQEREDGELFELKMALQLGRSLSELREFASCSSSSSKDEEMKDFAGKLF